MRVASCRGRLRDYNAPGQKIRTTQQGGSAQWPSFHVFLSQFHRQRKTLPEITERRPLFSTLHGGAPHQPELPEARCMRIKKQHIPPQGGARCVLFSPGVFGITTGVMVGCLFLIAKTVPHCNSSVLLQGGALWRSAFVEE